MQNDKTEERDMFLKFHNMLLAHHYIGMKAANIIYEDKETNSIVGLMWLIGNFREVRCVLE